MNKYQNKPIQTKSKLTDSRANAYARDLDKRMVSIRSSDNIVDRMNLERAHLFSYGDKQKEEHNFNMGGLSSSNPDSYPDSNPFKFEQGMPVRAQYNIKKPLHDSNMYMDFNIFNPDHDSKHLYASPVDSYEPIDNSKITHSDILSSMGKLSSQIQPVQICSDLIETKGFELFTHIQSLMSNSNININILGLVSVFAGLYIEASNTSEINLKQYFSFGKKDFLYTGMGEILSSLNSNPDLPILFDNYLILGNDLPYKSNPNTNMFFSTSIVNINNPSNEAERLSKLIAKKHTKINIPMKKSLCGTNIENLQVMGLSVCVIHPIWDKPFDIKANNKSSTSYLYKSNTAYDYFEDSNIKLLELQFNNGTMSMGILVPRQTNSFNPDINLQQIKYYIINLKSTMFDHIQIPMFKHDFKIKLTNILKEGLVSIFTKFTAPNLFPENAIFHDYIQNTTVQVDNANGHIGTGTGTQTTVPDQNKMSYHTMRKFIASKQFVYYFRIIQTNTIVLLGYYN